MKRVFKLLGLVIFVLLAFSSCKEENFDINFYDDYNDKPYDKVAFLMAHNAFASAAHNIGGLFKNQDISIPKQLEFGVRGLMMDVYYKSSYEGADQIFMCHGSNCGENGGLQDEAFPRAFVHYLNMIKTFMDENPEAVITIILQDGAIPSSKMGLVWQQVVDAGLDEQYFNPAGSDWNVMSNGSWPTIQWMIDNQKRLVIFSNTTENQFFPYQWTYSVENDYGSVGFQQCPKRDESDALDNTAKLLFVMNHFRSFLLGVDATADNNYNQLIKKVDNYCKPEAFRYPNFVAVDFVEQGKNGGALKVVNELNMRDDW
ncbi:MAG: hypothetical protein R2753_16185 [Chitinophagales bacterium]